MAPLFTKSLNARSIRNVLNASFGLMFAIPLLIFFYNVVRFSLLDHLIIKVSFAGILIFSLLGFIILRKMTDRIAEICIETERFSLEKGVIEKDIAGQGEQNELKQIAEVFQKLVARFEESAASLGKRVSELASLKELADISSKAADFNQLSGIVLEKLMITTGAESGIMLSTADEGRKLVVEAVRRINESLIPHRELAVEQTAFGRILGENKVFVGDDFSQAPGFNREFDSVFSGPFLAKAITARGSTIGILGLSRGKHGKSFGNPELDYISTALGQIAFAFDNAELIRELKASYEELKETQGKLIQYERVAAIHQTVVTLSDKINSPLTVIQGHAELMRRNASDSDERTARSLDAILESCGRCAEIMRKLYAIRKPETIDYAGGGDRMINIDSQPSRSRRPNTDAQERNVNE